MSELLTDRLEKLFKDSFEIHIEGEPQHASQYFITYDTFYFVSHLHVSVDNACTPENHADAHYAAVESWIRQSKKVSPDADIIVWRVRPTVERFKAGSNPSSFQDVISYKTRFRAHVLTASKKELLDHEKMTDPVAPKEPEKLPLDI